MQSCVRLVCLAAAGVCGFAAVDIPVIDEIVAKVNGDIITRSEIDRDRKGLETELQQRGAKGIALTREVDDKAKDLLRERIDGLLLVSKAKELNISVDTEVSKYMAELQKQSAIVDPDKFQEYVREQTGQSYEDYKSEVRNGMLRQRVIREQVGRTINIPRADVQKYYDEHKSEFMREERIFLREIFLSTEGKDAAAVEKKAKDL